MLQHGVRKRSSEKQASPYKSFTRDTQFWYATTEEHSNQDKYAQ